MYTYIYIHMDRFFLVVLGTRVRIHFGHTHIRSQGGRPPDRARTHHVALQNASPTWLNTGGLAAIAGGLHKARVVLCSRGPSADCMNPASSRKFVLYYQ